MQNRYWLDQDNNLIYELSISDIQESVDGKAGYIVYNAELVCGKEYPTDNYGIDGLRWCSPDYFVDDIKFEHIIQYFETESLAEAIEADNGWELFEGPLPRIYEWVDE